MTDGRPAAAAAEVLEALRRRGLTQAEVHWKRGRSRRLEQGVHGRVVTTCREAGWAVRAGNSSGSFFLTATGEPTPETPWPATSEPPVRLPRPGATGRRRRGPSEGRDPLSAEGELLAFMEGVEARFEAELAAGNILRANLEDGRSSVRILNGHGVEAGHANQAVMLTLEAAAGSPPASCVLRLAAKRMAELDPGAIGRRLANELEVRMAPGGPERERADLILSPRVGAAVLEGLMPLLVGPDALRLVRGLAGDGGRIASSLLCIVDDGGRPGGVLESPFDGEGSPTGAVSLVREGIFRRPLLTWWQAAAVGRKAAPCVRRPGWRDLPVPGPSHLWIEPDGEVPPSSLLIAAGRGHYLLEPLGRGSFDAEGDRFRLPVCGFALRSGRTAGAFASAVVTGKISALLGGLRAVARDLEFQPRTAMLGSPTLLATGLEIAAL